MSSPLVVTKMSGAGNDFVVLERSAYDALHPDPLTWIRAVCRRGVSLGADGVLIVEPTDAGTVRVEFRNPDGSEAFCGNGSRCAARYARLRGFADAAMTLETSIGSVPAQVVGAEVSLELPTPEDRGTLRLEVGGESVAGRWVVAGVPHFVIGVPDVAAVPLERWGPALRRHDAFGASGANIDLAGARGERGIAIRTWERGVEGETLACGSGAVAAAFAAHVEQGSPDAVTVVPASGIPLNVAFGAGAVCRLTGDARVICESAMSPEATSGFR